MLSSIQFDPEGKKLPTLFQPGPKDSCVSCHKGIDQTIIPSGSPTLERETKRWMSKARIADTEQIKPSPKTPRRWSKKNLQDFLKSAPQHPRYQKLTRLVASYKINSNDFQSANLHNTLMNYRIQRLMADQLARTLMKRPNYEKIKFDLWVRLWAAKAFNRPWIFAPSQAKYIW